jgi:endonuclease YncB( thermonuclease family)
MTKDAPLPVPEIGWCVPVRIVRVIDGDTLEVELTKRWRVRVLDCWCPESRTRNAEEKVKGLAAKTALESMVRDNERKGTLFVPGHDDLSDAMTLGRVLGRLWLADGRDVAYVQRSAGHATKVKPVTKGP